MEWASSYQGGFIMSQSTVSPLEVSLRGHHLLEEPLLNKGTAFSDEERESLCLHGLLPPHVETLETQLARAYEAFEYASTSIAKHVFLRDLQDTNEILFYALLTRHLSEMMPIVYTPVVGAACQHFSEIYQRPRGLFISYPRRAEMDQMLKNAVPDKVEVIVVTDGERILGLGDQGVDGMGIPIGKLALYSGCGGVHPAGALPITLDVGTNNQERRSHPNYLGWRNERIVGDEYYAFVDTFIQAVKRHYPNVLLQFEDFARPHAQPLLDKYRDELCCFNDDIQGTATVTLGAALAAVEASGRKLSHQRIALLGAGSAGCGIAEQLVLAMRSEGLSEQEARSRFYLVDRYGLLLEGMDDLTPAQQRFTRSRAELSDWNVDGEISLEDVAKFGQPTILIGVSGQPNTFTESIVKEMAKHTDRPIIFPLSNPTTRVEAAPEDILHWTGGKGLVATGSPFEPVNVGGTTHTVSQCNNCYIFPGMGQGILAVGASRVSDQMFIEASRALMSCSPAIKQENAPLLPPLDEIRPTSRKVAVAVARQAQKEGLATIQGDAEELVAQRWWEPTYQPFVPSKGV
jgi:malate dehydrogenase (oxaloacetate-decarboxylating)